MPPGDPPQDGERDVPADRGVDEQRLGLAVLGDQADSRGDRVGGAPRPVARAGESHLPARARTGAHDDVQEPAAPRSHEPRDAEHLAWAQGEVQRSEALGFEPARLERERRSVLGLGDLALGQEVLADHVAHDTLLRRLGRREVGHQPAVAEHHHPVGDRAHLRQSVADEDHDPPAARVPARELEHPAGFCRTERGGRLVEDQHERPASERLRDLDQLALRDRQGVDAPSRVDLEADRGEQLAGGGVHRPPVDEQAALARSPAEQQVLRDAQLADERKLLRDHRDAELLRVQGAAGGELPPRDRHGAGVGRDRAGYDPHHRRLAGPVLADEAHDLAPSQDQLVHVEHDGRPVQLADTGENEVPTGVRGAVARRLTNWRQLPCCTRDLPTGSPSSACRPQC